MSLLDSLASYGVNKLNVNPFTRGVTLTKEMVEQISVLRMPRLQNAYLVMVGENNFLYVINAENEVIIEDLAYLAIEDMKSLDQTVCSLAGKLTKEEMIMAREMKRQRDAYEEQVRKAMAQMPQDKQQSESEKNKEDFEMCATAGGLMPVEHDDPTLYELAKKAEHFEEVELLGAVIRISDIDELTTMGNKKEAYASAVATYKVARVNAVGRIYLGLTDGNTEEKTVGFIYTKKNGWELE
jgi:cyanate lyase